MFRYIRTNTKILIRKILLFRERHIDEKNFLIIVSILVGVFAGLVSVILKNLVHFIQNILNFNASQPYANYLFVIYPLIGITLTHLYVKIFHKGSYKKGLSEIIYSTSKNKVDIPKHNTYSQILTSSLTVGFGGSGGLEAPIVYTGSAIGVNTGKDLKFNHKFRTLLLACGAAGGISAIFNSPIAGVIFAMEVLLPAFSIPAFIPLLISSATAAVISRFFYTEQIFVLLTKGWDLEAIPFYFLLGIFCGLISAYFILITHKIENRFAEINTPYVKILAGGTAIGILIFLLPPLYGEGYSLIQQIFSGNYESLFVNSLFYDYKDNSYVILLVALAIILVKVFATGITMGAGGNAGTIAPSLFTGAIAGFFFSYAANMTGLVELNITNFTAVGMAGILSGVVHAPLTGIFLIAEVTGGYSMIVPLMIVSALSFFISRFIEPYSVYTKNLSEKGNWFPGNRDRAILEQIKLNDLLETNFSTVKPDSSLRDLIKTIAKSKRNVFPVTDKKGNLLGIITLDDVRGIILNEELYDIVIAAELMSQPVVVIDINENMDQVMEKFETYNQWNIPVIGEGIYLGFLSKSNIFNKYRSRLIDDSEHLI